MHTSSVQNIVSPDLQVFARGRGKVSRGTLKVSHGRVWVAEGVGQRVGRGGRKGWWTSAFKASGKGQSPVAEEAEEGASSQNF